MKDLINRLRDTASKGASVWGDLQMEAADALERLTAELESKLDSDLEKIAAERYKVVPAHESMFHRWAVVAGDGTQQLYLGREAECQNMARKFAGAFLDGAYLAQQLRQEVTTWSMTVENFEAELERERIRLAACGVVAMADTPDSAAKARQMLPEYESASCDDVKRRVDECMALRAERDALAADAARYRWLTADLDAVHERVRRNQILARIDSMSYSAACMTIDAVMKETNHAI